MAKKMINRKRATDKKQTKRIKQLEQFVYKTIENKQVNFQAGNINCASTGYTNSAFLRVTAGVGDGAAQGDPARIGNSVTLMKQQFSFNLKLRSSPDAYNQMRILIVESVEGSNALVLSDILEYNSYATHGDMVFASPYTTKTTTNRRYKIHMDKVVTLTPTHKPAAVLKHVVRYKGGKLVGFGGTSTESIPTNHRLQFFVLSDSVSIQHPQLDFQVRSTYKDA